MVLDIMREEKDIQAHDSSIALRKVKGDFYIFMGSISPNPSAKNWKQVRQIAWISYMNKQL